MNNATLHYLTDPTRRMQKMWTGTGFSFAGHSPAMETGKRAVNSVEELKSVLVALSRDARNVVTAGRPIHPGRIVRTGENFAGDGLRILVLDIDHPGPLGICTGGGLDRLPGALAAAGCVVQYTSSHNVVEGKTGLRLWYILDTEVDLDFVKKVALTIGADPNVYDPAHLLFIAPPSGLPPERDIKDRWSVRPGAPMVVVSALRELVDAGNPGTIAPAPDRADTAPERSTWTSGPLWEPPGGDDDDTLLEKARAARQPTDWARAWFSELFDADPGALSAAFPAAGRSDGLPFDASAADMALAARLAWWTAADASRVEALMRRSGLHRPKWNRADYLRRTIARACDDAVKRRADEMRAQVDGLGDLPTIEGGDTDGEPNAGGIAERSLTDEGNARRFADRFRDKVIYVPGRAYGWFLWDGMRWAHDHEGLGARRLAAESAQDILRGSSSDGRLAARARWWARSLSAAGITATLTTARGLMKVDRTRLDADPDTLCTPSGIVDLRTGAVRPATPRDLVSKLAGAPYDPGAPAPEWGRFLTTVVPDESLRGYLQAVCGYTLTGHTTMRSCFFLLGTGRNGKSTLGECLRHIMGEWSAAMADGFLNTGQKPADRARAIAPLIGKRLVLVSEMEEGSRFDEPFLKRLCGNDTLAGRLLFEETVDVVPQMKIMVYANHRPKIRGTDDGVWDRMKVIPFEIRIPDSQVDPDLPQRLQAEAAGILRWCVQGAVNWYRLRKLPPCEKVDAAVSDYRTAEDTIALWIEDACTRGEDHAETTETLYSNFREWSFRRGDRYPPGVQAFGMRLTALGVGRAHRRGGTVRTGITLRGLFDGLPPLPGAESLQA